MILLISAIITLTCIYALIQYFKKKFKYWESRNVPYEKPTMFFGSFLRFCFEKDNLRKYLDRTGIKFDSPYYGFFVFSRPILVIKDIDIVKRIMIKDFASFPNKLFLSDKNCDPVFNNSLFNTREEEWKSIRYKLSPVFTSGKLKVMFSLIRECSESLISYLEKMLDKDVEVTNVLSKFSTDVIASCAFGVKSNCFKMEMNDFQYYGENIFSKGTMGVIKNLSYIFVHSIVKIFKYSYLNPNAVRYFRKVFQEVVKERTTHNCKRNDFVDILLDLKRNERKFEKFLFDDERMLAQAIPFFAAGQETTTALVSFTLHELSLNNAIQKRLRHEIVETVNKYGDISYEALKDMKYLKMVISETLRKYPLISFLQRESHDNYVIPETGLQLERGIGIIVPIRSFHHNPMYFPNPEVYDPERFSNDSEEQVDSNTLLAFGIGPRNCLGKRFAIITMKMALLHILKNFKVERCLTTTDTLIIESPHITRSLDGVHLKFSHL